MSERDIFTAACEMTDPVTRSAYVDRACEGDTELKCRVEALLRAHDQPDSLLDQPAVAPHGTASAATLANEHEGSAAGDDQVPLGFLAPATRPDSLGRIGHYEVLQLLGQGGFGIVFRAFDDVLHRVLAVKVLSPQLAVTSPARKRFLREARSSAQVRHENVVQVYEVGEQPLPYIAMEFIPGETLQQRLDRVGPVEPAEVVRVGRQVAEGLAAAHATDLIHRDIKPGNILLEGGQHKVKITDFGLARAADDASISQSGIIAGTPMYMAPEQAKGEKLDQRADLFSLGSVLYQMAAGRPPFRATGTVAVLKRVAEDTPRDIREVIPETPQWLCDIIARLHEKSPDDRFQSAREVADVLADCEAQLKANARPKEIRRIPRGKARPSGRWKWVAAALAALLLLAFAGTWFGRAAMLHFSDRGELELLPEAGLVSVIVLQNNEGVIDGDKPHAAVTDWLDMRKSHTLSLPPGRYQLNVGTWPAGTHVSQWEVTSSGPLGSSEVAVPVINSSAIVAVERGRRVTLRARMRTDSTLLPPPPSSSSDDGFAPLYNGKDLSGWKALPEQPGTWRVLGGILVGRNGPGHLYSARDDYQNFHLRAEVAVDWGGDQGGDADIYFRAKPQPPGPPGTSRSPSGYTAEIAFGPGAQAGALSFRNPQNDTTVRHHAQAGVKPDEWFTLEVIADRTHLVTKVNGATAVDVVETLNAYPKGHIALQVWRPANVLKVRKLEIKELPPSAPAAPLSFKNSLGMEFVLVPTGRFWMGGGGGKAGDRDFPIPYDFYLGKYEVTQEEWAKVMKTNPSSFQRTGLERNKVTDIDEKELKRFPVDNVSWDSCQAFVARLNELEQVQGWKYRLPTEAEWEYACRGGAMASKIKSAFDFYLEEPLNRLSAEQANTSQSGLGRTCKVGSYPPNPLGLYDMHGNVWEWCDDVWEEGFTQQVHRGGSYRYDSEFSRAAHRGGHPPSYKNNDHGLRLARVPVDVKLVIDGEAEGRRSANR